MDILDTPTPFTPSSSTAPKPSERQENGHAGSEFNWTEVVANLGSDVAGPLTAALERVNSLTTTGKIDRADLRALRNEIEYARNAAVNAQQLTRLSSGRLRQSHERLQLSDMLMTVLEHRGREFEAKGVNIRPRLAKAIHVIADASLLFSLLNAMVDWALHHTRTPIELEVDQLNWPPHGVIRCRFAPIPPDQAESITMAAMLALDSMSWRLVELTAQTMKLPLKRENIGNDIRVSLEFPSTLANTLAEMEEQKEQESHHGFSLSQNSQPLAGSHVLIVSARRDVRTKVRQAIANMGLIIDMVGSVDEAVDFCNEGLPHAIIIESALRGPRFSTLMQNIRNEVPNFAFIELTEDENPFELSTWGNLTEGMAQVGRPVMEHTLPEVLISELSKAL